MLERSGGGSEVADAAPAGAVRPRSCCGSKWRHVGGGAWRGLEADVQHVGGWRVGDAGLPWRWEGSIPREMSDTVARGCAGAARARRSGADTENDASDREV